MYFLVQCFYFLIIYIFLDHLYMCLWMHIFVRVCVCVCVYALYWSQEITQDTLSALMLQKQYEPRIYEIIKLRFPLCFEHAGFVEILALGVSCVQRAWMITVKEHCCHNFVILHTGAHTHIHQYTHIRKPHMFIYIKLIYHVKKC